MKLVFPGGEHPQVLLGHGVNRVGSDPDANIVIDRPGVMPQHCQLHVTAHGVMLDVPRGITVCVNDRQVDGLISLRAGDTIVFDNVRARLASMEAVNAAVGRVMGVPGAALLPANDDPGVTAVRAVLPKYVLRGVSAQVSGRNVPLHGVTTVGRAPDCALRLDETGISRVHARLVPTDAGVQIEDLGSTNGSFVNDIRVLRAVAKPGDEIGFDSLRFRLMAPGQAEPAVPVDPAMPTATRPRREGARGRPVVRVVVILAIIALVASVVATQLR